jgi:rubrerythrin
VNALNSYASGRGKYEFPILICDASMKANGGRGFVLTPDHIFYNTITEAGILDVMNVEKITSHKGKKIYAETEHSGRIKLSNSLDLSNVEEFTEILDEFVAYLKEKPESRDVAYIAKEKHSVKCCYRCGHVYKGDNVCPKCGAKFNE